MKKTSNYIKKKIESLEYKVYINNNNGIKEYNIFNHNYLKEKLCEFACNYERDKSIETFILEVDLLLKYCFWSKCEYEIVLTSWPPYIDVEEIDKMKNEVEEHNRKWGSKQYRCNANLTVAEKIDVYDQIKLNWNLFINYITKEILE